MHIPGGRQTFLPLHSTILFLLSQRVLPRHRRQYGQRLCRRCGTVHQSGAVAAAPPAPRWGLQPTRAGPGGCRV